MIAKMSWMRWAAGILVPVVGYAQNQPLPKPVSPPLPIQSNPPPANSNNARLPGSSDVAASASGTDAVLAPFLDSQTIGVVQVDLKGVDIPATRDWAVQSVDELRKATKEIVRARDNVRDEINKAADRVEKFRSAGIGQFYVVIGLADLMENRPPFMVVPLHKDADANAVEQALLGLVDTTSMMERDRPVARRLGRTVVLAAPQTIDRLKAAAPSRLPNLASVFDAAGKGQIRVALIPQEGARKTVENLVSSLPDELGGGPIQVVSRGMQWMSLAIGLPSSPSLKIVVQATDAAAAEKLNEVITKAIAWAGQRKEGPPEGLAFAQLVGGLKTQVNVNRVSINLDPEEMNKLAAVVAGAFLQAQNASQRVHVAANLRQLGLAIMLYANVHNGRLPNDLGPDLTKYLSGDIKQFWADPLRPDEKKPYVYLKLADKLSDIKEPQSAVMIYENHTTWDDGINVAFADGHVEWMTDEKQFKLLLDETKKNNPMAVEMPQ